jgi:hypothetical protein
MISTLGKERNVHTYLEKTANKNTQESEIWDANGSTDIPVSIFYS